MGVPVLGRHRVGVERREQLSRGINSSAVGIGRMHFHITTEKLGHHARGQKFGLCSVPVSALRAHGR